MKKVFIVSALLIVSASVKAQTEKGTKMIGLNAIGQNVVDWGYSNPQIGFAPSFQCFAANNFSIFTELALGFSKERYSYYENKNFNYEFFTGVRKYFSSQKLKPFIFAGIGFGKQREERSNLYIDNNGVIQPYSNSYTNRFLHFSAQFGSGVLYSPTKFINIETSFGLTYRDGVSESSGGYYYYYYSPDIVQPQPHYSYINSYINPFVKLGVQISIPPKKKD